jgi:hypothetical protein
MYISLKRSQHALYALSFFILMVLTVFSTLLLVGNVRFPFFADFSSIATLRSVEPGMRTWASSSTLTVMPASSQYVSLHSHVKYTEQATSLFLQPRGLFLSVSREYFILC